MLVFRDDLDSGRRITMALKQRVGAFLTFVPLFTARLHLQSRVPAWRYLLATPHIRMLTRRRDSHRRHQDFVQIFQPPSRTKLSIRWKQIAPMTTMISIFIKVKLTESTLSFAPRPERYEQRLAMHRGGPVFRNRMAAWLRWILGSITPPISPRLSA
jgi:hypothetical protein